MAVLLGVLAAAYFAYGALAAPPLAAPAITVKPANPSASTAANFTFTDSVSVTFWCSLNASVPVSCGTGTSSSRSYTAVQGSNTFQVYAKTATQTSSTTSWTWLVDSIPPSVSTVARVGSSPTNAASVQWTVTFSEPVKGVDATDFALAKVGLGGSPAVTAVSPNISTLATSFTVTASTGSGSGTLGLNVVDNDSIVDAVGNKLGGTGAGNGNFTGPPASVYTIDRTPPVAPVITVGPAASPAWTTTTSVSFTFTGEAGASFLCKMDGGSFVACTSAQPYSGLGQGSHTFQVEQTDAAGNTGPAASRTFRIDSIAPAAPVVTSGPVQYPPFGWASTNAVFTFGDSSSDVVSFQCKLDGALSFSFCLNPQPYTALAQGQHTLLVKAVDGAGNVSGASSPYVFFVDTVKPNTPSLSGPPASTSSQNATFTWTDTDPGFPTTGTGIALYLCKLDGGFYLPCTSPTNLTGLTFASHTFSVVAVDWAGNISLAATQTWTISNATGLNFTVHGNISGLKPGLWLSIPVTIDNPNNEILYVTSLTVTVSGVPNGCDSTVNVEKLDSAASLANKFPVPALAVGYAVPLAFQPQIRLKNTASSQDNCKLQSFSLTYGGTGTNQP